MVMLGLAPKINGYAGVFGDSVPVSGQCTASQKECLKHLSEVYKLTRPSWWSARGAKRWTLLVGPIMRSMGC